jgi:hypothetical protein
LRFGPKVLAPGALVTVDGQGCTPGAIVNLAVDGHPAGATVANPNGTFATDVQLDVMVGRHTVMANCGATLIGKINVLLTSQGGPPTTVAVILLALLLLILGLGPRQLFSDNKPSWR